jgi:glyoxylase-like metal-dependent hydrolase (beta-lactamase superfamily II)
MKPAIEGVAPGVTGLRIVMVNVFLVSEVRAGTTEWWLVDAGLPGAARTIRQVAEERFGRGTRPRFILLTHGHFDHVGSLRDLADGWDVPVYAHPLEHPYLTGRSAYPPPDPSVGGGAMAWSARLLPRGPIDLGARVRALPADGTVPGSPEWRWLPTPGHSPGHVSLFREGDRTLVAGDAVVTVKQESLLAILAQAPRVHRPPAYFTTDWQAAGRSVRALAELAPEILATGHGRSLGGPAMQAQLEELAADFERRMPRRGRYVREPARADERGVISVPPAPGLSPWTVALGAAAAGAALYGVSRAAARPRHVTSIPPRGSA